MKELNLEDILAQTSDLKEKKVWYTAVIGRPNTGKSTFINTLLGEKVSITSKTPQTTRKRILAMYNDEESQIIFFDTPGVHDGKQVLNEYINKEAITSMREANVVLYFIDSSREGGEEEKYIRGLLEFVNVPIIKIYTKIDLPSAITIPDGKNSLKISSVDNFWLEEVITSIKKYLPTAPMLFSEDMYTKQDIFFRISEIVREKVFIHTKEELPHATYVGIEEVNDENPDLLKIVAYVYTETDSQKYIIIGKNGKLLTRIGTEARKDLEKIFGTKVFLSLRVKVQSKWRKNEKLVKKMF